MVDGRRLVINLGGAAPQHNQPRGAGPLLEPRMSSINISALSFWSRWS
jgi:hypothetical protein